MWFIHHLAGETCPALCRVVSKSGWALLWDFRAFVVMPKPEPVRSVRGSRWVPTLQQQRAWKYFLLPAWKMACCAVICWILRSISFWCLKSASSPQKRLPAGLSKPQRCAWGVSVQSSPARGSNTSTTPLLSSCSPATGHIKCFYGQMSLWYRKAPKVYIHLSVLQ